MSLVPSQKVRREDFIKEIDARRENPPFFHVFGDMKGPRLFRVSMELHPVIAELIERGAWEDILELMQVREYAERVEYHVSTTYVLLQALREPLPNLVNPALEEIGLEPANILDVICFLRAYSEYAHFFADQHLLATGSAWRRPERPEGEEQEGCLPHVNGWQIPFLPLDTDSRCAELGLRTSWPAVVMKHDSRPRDDPREYLLARVSEKS